MGKIKLRFDTAIHKTKETLDCVHTDVWGTTKTASFGWKHYFVTFIDDYSRKNWVYTIKNKDEVLEIFVEWKRRM